MNVLMLVEPGVDHLQDIVHHGLVSLVGPDRVFELPDSPRYHGESLDDDDFPYLRTALPSTRRTLDDALQSADAIVVGSVGDTVLPLVHDVLERRARPLIAFLDGTDDPYVRGIVRRVDVYFKREVLASATALRLKTPARRIYHRVRRYANDPLRRHIAVAHAGSARIVPLPFGIIDTGFTPTEEKKYDIAFLASPTSPERTRVVSELMRLEANGLKIAVGGDRRLDWNTYLDILASSRVGISVRGCGFDTYRYWEIPYAGTALASENLPIVIPRNFAPEAEAAFSHISRLVDTAVELLAGARDRELAEAGRRAVLERHTSTARAATVLEHLEQARTTHRARTT